MQDGPALMDGPTARDCPENALGTPQVCYRGCGSRLHIDSFTDCPWVRLRVCHRKRRGDPCFHAPGSVGQVPGQEEAAQFDPAQAAGTHSRGLG